MSFPEIQTTRNMPLTKKTEIISLKKTSEEHRAELENLLKKEETEKKEKAALKAKRQANKKRKQVMALNKQLDALDNEINEEANLLATEEVAHKAAQIRASTKLILNNIEAMFAARDKRIFAFKKFSAEDDRNRADFKPIMAKVDAHLRAFDPEAAARKQTEAKLFFDNFELASLERAIQQEEKIIMQLEQAKQKTIEEQTKRELVLSKTSSKDVLQDAVRTKTSLLKKEQKTKRNAYKAKKTSAFFKPNNQAPSLLPADYLSTATAALLNLSNIQQAFEYASPYAQTQLDAMLYCYFISQIDTAHRLQVNLFGHGQGSPACEFAYWSSKLANEPFCVGPAKKMQSRDAMALLGYAMILSFNPPYQMSGLNLLIAAQQRNEYPLLIDAYITLALAEAYRLTGRFPVEALRYYQLAAQDNAIARQVMASTASSLHAGISSTTDQYSLSSSNTSLPLSFASEGHPSSDTSDTPTLT